MASFFKWLLLLLIEVSAIKAQTFDASQFPAPGTFLPYGSCPAGICLPGTKVMFFATFNEVLIVYHDLGPWPVQDHGVCRITTMLLLRLLLAPFKLELSDPY